MPLYAGICETNITPPLGVWMCGYAFRPSGCTSVHDELYARALVLNDGQNALAILSTDLLGLDFDMVERVRSGIRDDTGIPEHAIMLAATHTHGGPNGREFTTMGSRDPAYIDVLARKLIGVTKQAAANMAPASLAYGRAPVQIGVNRRAVDPGTHKCTIGVNFYGPVAPHVDTLSVLDSRGNIRALLFCHACHPTTLGGENLAITGDFPGFACEEIRKETSGRVMPVFLQGFAGNINPHPRGSFVYAQSHGRTLAEAALAASERAEPVDGISLDYRETVIELPLIPPPKEDECLTRIDEWHRKLDEDTEGGNMGRILHAQGMLKFAEYELTIAREARPKLNKSFAIQLLKLGNVKLLGMPAEMFVQYALDFQAQSEGLLIPVAYANGVHGYMPTAVDYAYGGYEVDGSHRYYGTLAFAPECERTIRKTVYQLLGIEKPDWTHYSV